MRQAADRANGAKLTNGERRVFASVLALVASWSRLTDWIYVGEVAEHARLSERHTRDCLRRLAELEIITWEPRRGRGVRSRLGLPPAAPTPPSAGKAELSAQEKPEPAEAENRKSWGSDARGGPREGEPEETTTDRRRADAGAPLDSGGMLALDDDATDSLHELVDLIHDLGDGDAKTLATFERLCAREQFSAEQIDYVTVQIRKRSDYLESPAAYAYGVFESMASGYSGPTPAPDTHHAAPDSIVEADQP